MVDAVIIKSERERPLGREFPEMFRPERRP
jgi:hypothetical protein